MFPRGLPGRVGRSDPPCVSGGVSMDWIARWMSSLSSPRQRGCFLLQLLCVRDYLVFPAPAGVFPMPRRARPICMNLPRASGGVSHSGLVVITHSKNSSYQLGCFQYSNRAKGRASGGVSEECKNWLRNIRFSPSQWGCFQH